MNMHTNNKLTIDGSIVLRPLPDGEPTLGPDILTTQDGEIMYRINRYDTMPPFLMSLVSDSDLWLYVSSYGALTAGRIDEEHCLFPYVTDDQLHRATGTTGPITTLRVHRPGQPIYLWEPFARFPAANGIERNCYKNFLSNRITFEEINHGLGMTFRYTWSPSDRFGFIRAAVLENHDGFGLVNVDVIDGIVNLLPSGVGLLVQQRYGCLIDAYTRCEVDEESGVGLFALASMMVDRPEPAESLITSVVWCRGLDDPTYLLSADQIPAFRAGQSPQRELLLTGRRGAYLVAASLTLEPGESHSWDFAADVNLDQSQVESLRQFLRSDPDPRSVVRESIQASRDALARIVSAADGLEATADTAADAHLAACVMFNSMRGGVFAHNYDVNTADFREFVIQRNKKVAGQHAEFLAGLPVCLTHGDLKQAVESRMAPDLVRLADEYLPLTFSRRHGDPSRPWNRFAIHVKNPDGSEILNYQGNWRDIFQNWEALCLSFPGFIESCIAKFVNASTADGYNPYRLSREGIDWEKPEPGDPWAAIGYWGDHQIIYLLKFLEASHHYHPGQLDRLLAREQFSYANVPYRIKPYAEILRDNRKTIVYDGDLDADVEARVADYGSDAKLILTGDGAVYHVTLAEKLLVPALAKLSNLVLDGGIWMNTQRPEWNDANNALVGNGISMVTLCYLRRYLAFCRELFERCSDVQVKLSIEIDAWLHEVLGILEANRGLLDSPQVIDSERRRLLDSLGGCFSEYRERLYRDGFSGRAPCSLSLCRDLCALAIDFLDHSVRANRREDGLYHAYNLLEIDGKAARIRRLYEMLEGQVAVLSAGVLSAEESGTLARALFKSPLYRADQNSFLLYPARQLPSFLRKNTIPEGRVDANPLLTALIKAGDRSIVVRDVAGHYRFNASFQNAEPLTAALDLLSGGADWRDLVHAHRQDVLDIYEAVFDHHAFTGRSGGMYGYEGLGCIYWHMVSKLMVALQESYAFAEQRAAPPEAIRALAIEYYRVREGMGFNKSARQYGAFPSDPYSHTPAHAGARQPGMTGQSKEDILARWGELGIAVRDGCLIFHPSLLRRSEFLTAERVWHYFDRDGHKRDLVLPVSSLGFTVCVTPVVYKLGQGSGRIVVHHADGSHTSIKGNALDAQISGEVFDRSGRISHLEVSLPESLITLE